MPVLSLWLYLAAGVANVKQIDFSDLWEKNNRICWSQQIMQVYFFLVFFFFFLSFQIDF